MTHDEPKYPPTIFYGTKPLDIRFRSKGARQTFYCLNNFTLHLTDKSFAPDGTYPTCNFLGRLCVQHCRPNREDATQPCPAFVESHDVTDDGKALASVKPRAIPRFDLCGGVAKLLDDIEMTREERFLFLAYHEDRYGDEAQWRDGVVAAWNDLWWHVPDGWDATSRRAKFDVMLWRTVRFPALIPQVWLNWLYAASAEEQKMLDENPSRIDFMSFPRGERHVVEIDGPSHYARLDLAGYTVDENAYARNLKIARSLLRDGWMLTRIGRSEVRGAMPEADPARGIDNFFETLKLLQILPFHETAYPPEYSYVELGVPELRQSVRIVADDDIPF